MEPGTMEQTNFGGAGDGTRAKLSYFVELELEPEPSKFLLAPAPSNTYFYIWKPINSWS